LVDVPIPYRSVPFSFNRKATVDKYPSVFKAFFNWCDVQGTFHANPVRTVRIFRLNNQIVQYLNDDEYQRLLTAAEKIRWYL
jgi:site-specific recombinase XerD